jgi:hypothetical protein
MTRRESGASRDRTETMTMPGTDADVIDALVGIEPGSSLDAVRARRPEARAHAQASYRALFEPGVPGAVTAQERFAVGTFVAGLHGEAAIAAFYAQGLSARAPARCAKRLTPRSRRPGRGSHGSFPGSAEPREYGRAGHRVSRRPPRAGAAPRRGLRARAPARLAPA